MSEPVLVPRKLVQRIRHDQLVTTEAPRRLGAGIEADPLLMRCWKPIPACSASAFRIPGKQRRCRGNGSARRLNQRELRVERRLVERADSEAVAVQAGRHHGEGQRRQEGSDLTQRDHLAYQET
jgi:hypothetical protein